ncbi:MAG TPA: YopX family protein, partial [Candidatus Jeotgalibaca merdavium]|nr:YopX family protein [Candidatus Jeotgalibaca merdavium]
KFRAWDKAVKDMVPIKTIDFGKDGAKCAVDFCDINGDLIGKNSEWVLMQYTGMKDKNGEEIYEGDIVRVTDGDGNINFSDGGIGTITGMEELFMWYIDGQVQNGLFDINMNYFIEVIRNIYENQELLGVES